MGVGPKLAFSDSRGLNPNPNPYRFKIKRAVQKGSYLVIEINYPDCTNYEGNKILVFRGITIGHIVGKKEGIDPHFDERGNLVARFVPTEEGWNTAIMFSVYMNDFISKEFA